MLYLIEKYSFILELIKELVVYYLEKL